MFLASALCWVCLVGVFPKISARSAPFQERPAHSSGTTLPYALVLSSTQCLKTRMYPHFFWGVGYPITHL